MIKRGNNRNSIRGLMIDGIWCEDPKKIKDEMFRYQKTISTECNNVRPTFLCDRVAKLSDGEAALLEVVIIEKEVWEACACGSDKAPGPDGLNFKYIKKFWGILKRELLVAIRWFWDKMEM